MTPEHFALWLQGFAELSHTPPTPEQWKSIREHLATVFNKVTPPVQTPAPKPPENDSQVLERIKRELADQAAKKAPFKFPKISDQPWPTPPFYDPFPKVIC